MRLLEFIPNRQFWRDYFVRNITEIKDSNDQDFDSSFKSVIVKLVEILGVISDLEKVGLIGVFKRGDGTATFDLEV